MNDASPEAAGEAPGISPDWLLQHWQGHRRLTRRVIEAFPPDELFSFSIGRMRSFGTMMMEVIGMSVPMVQGAVDGVWDTTSNREARPKEDVLRLWDETTAQINALWPKIPPARFRETLRASQWELSVYEAILYAIDNEIHHRAQGNVYLRALEIEPPTFYKRQ